MATNNADWIQPSIRPRFPHTRLRSGGIVAPSPYSAVEFLRQIDQLVGARPVDKIILKLDDGDIDLSSRYQGGAVIEQNKEDAPDQITSGDMALTFSNADNYLSEFDSSSALYGKTYHDRQIEFHSGFRLPDDSKQFIRHATMKVVKIEAISNDSSVIIYCQDAGRRFLDDTVNTKPSTMIPSFSGTGDGVMSDVAIKPFATIAEDWTITCTLGGSDGVATFSVVGSISGNIGTATSGTEFSGTKIKFTIFSGSTDWVSGDVFTLSTVQMMEYNLVNPVKILWSILTGYDFDSNSQEAWYSRTPQFSPLQSNVNPDLDYPSFIQAMDAATFTMKGYIPWDTPIYEAMQDIILHFLGGTYVNAHGKLAVTWFKPSIGVDTVRSFSSAKKNYEFLYRRDVERVINYATCQYKKQDSWDWDDQDFTYDGFYINSSATSIANLRKRAKNFTSRWYSSSGAHVKYFVDRLVDRYQEAPVEVEFVTGIDGMLLNTGDKIMITDTKAGISGQTCEVMRLQKDFTNRPRTVRVNAIFSSEGNWAFLGSTADEGDGISPQASSYDSASAADKRFCYLGHRYSGLISYRFDGTTTPQSAATYPWTAASNSHETVDTESSDGSQFTLQITGDGVAVGSRHYYFSDVPFADLPTTMRIGFVAKFTDLKTKGLGTSSDWFYLAFTNGHIAAELDIYQDVISLQGNDFNFHANDGLFHEYLLLIEGPSVKLYIDEVLWKTISLSTTTGNIIEFGLKTGSASTGTVKMIVKELFFLTNDLDLIFGPSYRIF